MKRKYVKNNSKRKAGEKKTKKKTPELERTEQSVYTMQWSVFAVQLLINSWTQHFKLCEKAFDF